MVVLILFVCLRVCLNMSMWFVCEIFVVRLCERVFVCDVCLLVLVCYMCVRVCVFV